MIYILPTKRGIGVELWGNYDDLSNLYNFIGKFWNDENNLNKKDFDIRDKLLSGFSYEIRKAKEGSRFKRETSHFSFENQEYYGCQISWVHILFTLSALKYNMRYYETNKLDISHLLLIEFWLENAMKNYDEATATILAYFIEDGLYGANKYIYQYMRCINLDFLLLGGGKAAFRKLPELLRKGIFYSNEYNEYEKYLKDEAKRLNCEVTDLELDDNNFDYEKIKW
jgi:hypothetical protein